MSVYDSGRAYDDGSPFDADTTSGGGGLSTAPVVVYPDVEAVAGNWLAQQLAALGTPAIVARRVPNPRPARFVTVRRNGGQPDTPVTEAAQLTVDVWGSDDVSAIQLANTCRALLKAAWGANPFGVIVTRYEEFSGPVNFPDPLSNQPRYTFTCRLSVRGTPLTIP